MSKNNPENRGEVTELRKFNGKEVRPVRYINRSTNSNFIAAMFADGTLPVDANTKLPIPYSKI
jgi:hypothetical protein